MIKKCIGALIEKVRRRDAPAVDDRRTPPVVDDRRAADACPRLVLNKPSSAMSSILLDRQEYLKRDADDARIYVYLA